MNIATLNPAAVRTFKPGTFFYCNFGGHAELALVCALEQEPTEPRVILKLADGMISGENDLLDFKEEQHRVAVPLELASVESTPEMVRLNSGSGATDGVDAPGVLGAVEFVVANSKGYWVEFGTIWVNLASGLISERAPSAPWVELGSVRLLDGAGNAFADMTALPNC